MPAGSNAGGAGSHDSENNAILIGVVVAALFFGIPLFYAWHRGSINQILFWVAQFELLAVAAPWWSHTGGELWNFLTHSRPQAVSWQQMETILTIAGGYFRFLLVPLLLLSAWLFYRRVGWIEKYTRIFTMESLLDRNARIVPSLLPVARRKRRISEEPTGSGPWRVAESPMLFALRHQIIVDREEKPVLESWCYGQDGMPRGVPKIPDGGMVFLDRRAKEVLVSRMGPPAPTNLRAFRQLPAYYRGLAGAFCAFGLGKREEGQQILDAMSVSFSEKEALKAQDAHGVAGHFPINISTADAWVIRALKPRPDEENSTEADLSRQIQRAIAKHESFLYVWLGALLEVARFNGGVLPAYEFLWLRPTNRELWYFLTSLGGNSVFTEGAAAWDHYRAEDVGGKTILYTAFVDESVKALKGAIMDEGWFDEKE